MINHRNLISFVMGVAVVGAGFSLTAISSISTAQQMTKSKDCAAALSSEFPIKDAPVRERSLLKIPKDWVSQAEFEIKYEVPTVGMLNLITQIAQKNVVGDGADQSRLAIDLLFQFSEFCPEAYTVLQRLELMSRDRQLVAYIQLRLEKSAGHKPN